MSLTLRNDYHLILISSCCFHIILNPCIYSDFLSLGRIPYFLENRYQILNTGLYQIDLDGVVSASVVRQFGTGQFGTGQFGTRTIWHQDNLAPDNLAPGQFGTNIIKTDNLAPDNLAPGQFGTNIIKRTIWHQEKK